MADYRQLSFDLDLPPRELTQESVSAEKRQPLATQTDSVAIAYELPKQKSRAPMAEPGLAGGKGKVVDSQLTERARDWLLRAALQIKSQKTRPKFCQIFALCVLYL